jgi:hypothetical protein
MDMARAALGYLAAAYSAQAWLIHQAHITSGAAVGHTASAKRTRGQSPFLPVTSVMPMSGSVALGRARMGS